MFLNTRLDGRFPGHGPNPWEGGAFEMLGGAVRRARADLGVIFDADGDRVFFADDRGRTVPSDIAAFLIGEQFRGPVLLDVRNGFLARELFRAARRAIRFSRVGHYFVKRAMRARQIAFGAEFSGHYYFRDFFYCDAGILAAIEFTNSVSRLGMRLGDWIDLLPRYYGSGEVNFKAKDKSAVIERIYLAYRAKADRISRLDGLKMEFGKGRNAWWLLVRPSNTEDLLRLTVEARDKDVFRVRAKELKALIHRQ